MFNCVGVRFADSISFFLRPNYFIFIAYLKMGSREGSSSEPPLDAPLCFTNIIYCIIVS